jgi:hypothetical protein
MWEDLGGKCSSPPAVASWGANRVDIFGIGTDKQMCTRRGLGISGPRKPSGNRWVFLSNSRLRTAQKEI